MMNNRKLPENIYSKPMDLFRINPNPKLTQSISEYENSLEKTSQPEHTEDHDLSIINLDKNHIANIHDSSKHTRSANNSSKRKTNRSQRYLKEKGDNKRSDQMQHERHYSSVNKKSQEIMFHNQEMPKTIQQQISKTKNPRILELAMRYGMYNEKPRNNFYLSIKKRGKNQCPTAKNQQRSSLSKNQTFILQRKRSFSKDPQNVNENKVSLGTLNIDPNQDKSISLMLDRKNITTTAKQYSSQNVNIDLTILQRNKLMVQTPSTKTNKTTQRKIEFFLYDNFDIDLTSVKSKMAGNCSDTNNKTECMKINNKKISKFTPKQFKTSSQQIHVPFKIQTNKHSSFASIKNATNNKNSASDFTQKPSILQKTQIIPASITFKKDKTKNASIIDKITNSVQIQDKKDAYFQFQSKNPHINSKQIPSDQVQTVSIAQRPKTHKESRVQTDSNVLKKSRRELFSVKPTEYTFVFDSKDHPYILEYLLENGWNQFYSTKLNNIHTLKWVNNPVASDILNMKEGQFYNHFHKSFELTSKSFLNTNLKVNRHFLLTHQFFPDTYDIGNDTEKQEFIENYKYNVMMELLQKIILHCYTTFKDPNFIKLSIDDTLLLYENEDYLSRSEEQKKLQNQFFNAMELENYKQPDGRFKLNIFLVSLALKYFQRQRRKYDMDFKQNKHNFLMFKKDQFDKNYDILELYCQQQDLGKPATQLGLYSYHYATPSELLLKLLIKEYCFFSKLNKWKYPIQSLKNNASNIWIVKPSSNARGNGIYLEKNMQSMLKSAKDIQSRIVQKYIQRPLLFKNTKFQYLNNHKFDIRQWVLLKSLDPLEIYMFSHFYLRLASEKYQIKDIQNNKVHLTNFSANKEFFKSNQHSIVNSDDFVKFLKEEYYIDWEEQIKPKVKEIVIKSIQSCQEKLQAPVNGTCFELLGYDILIDQNFTPWLIEVNMSPACEERVDWLSEYLRNMNEGLLELVIPENHFRKPFLPSSERKQKWEKIHFEEYHFLGKEYDPKLEIVSKEFQVKQKINRQAQESKSRSSLSNSMSPTKFRRKSTNQSLKGGDSVHRLRKQCMSGFEERKIVANKEEDEINEGKLEDQANVESFVLVEDEVVMEESQEENIRNVIGGEAEEMIFKNDELDQTVINQYEINQQQDFPQNLQQNKAQIEDNTYIDEFQGFN